MYSKKTRTFWVASTKGETLCSTVWGKMTDEEARRCFEEEKKKRREEVETVALFLEEGGELCPCRVWTRRLDA